MRLTWNEIRVRAASFSQEWADATYEKGETQSFYDAFFYIFCVKRRQVAQFEKYVKKINNKNGFIDLFWPATLLVEQKSAGRNLEKTFDQALDYCGNLKPSEQPRFLLLCDFQNFVLHDLSERRRWSFTLESLPEHIEKFAFILGVQKRSFKDQDPVNIGHWCL